MQVRDGNGHVTVTEYNALNLPWKQHDPAPFDNQVTETSYDKNGRPISVTDRRGHVTTTEYDALGRVVTVTDPLQQSVTTTYDAVGNALTVTDKRGIVTSNTYDDRNRLIEQGRAGVRLVSNEYDAVGNLTAVVDANGNRTEHAYTGRNLLEVTTFADGTSASRSYDGVGKLLTRTDEEGKPTTYTYDRENRETSVTFAGETTAREYDAVGNLTAVVKPRGNGRSMAYDGLRRLASVSEGGLTTAYAFDGNDNLRFQTDPLGHRVEYVYDPLNRKVQHIQEKAGGNLLTGYGYDAEGNLEQMTDAKGQVFRYEYDELGRRTKTIYPVVTTPFLSIREVTTGYDANNNVETVTETKKDTGGGTVTDLTSNTWDNFDRLKTSTQRGRAIGYGYDANGNRTQVATASGTTDYTFDARNRLATAAAGADVTTYTYTPDGLTDTISYPNGASVKYTYFPSNRVETITHKDTGGAIISSFAYQYDPNGNRSRQVEVQAGATETTDYVYDDLDRLKKFTLTAGATTTVTGYTFEGYNRKTETVTENGAVVTSKIYSYDETNWLTRVVDGGRIVTYGYDTNGNTILKSDSSKPGEDVTFDYDVANHLVRTTQGAAILGRYDYNADGMRVRNYGSERGDVSYFYDDGAVLEEYVDGAGGGLLAHYRYGDRLLSLDAPNDGGVQYYHHDALGSTVNLTDSAGAAKVSYTIDPWGHIRNQVGTSVNRQIFTGQEHDEQTGLIYFGARYYDPDSARFISQDSYLGEPGTPPSLHRYLYAYSNPTVWVDLDGHSAINEWGLLGSADERIMEADAALEGLDQAKQEDFAAGNDYMGWKYSAETVLYGGYKAGLVAAREGLNSLDYVIDVATLNTQSGEQRKRTLARMDAVNDGIEAAIDAGETAQRVTKEDPTGVASLLVSSAVDKIPEVVKGVKETLDNVYLRGNTKESAVFAGILIGSIEPTKKIKAAKKFLEGFGETVQDVSEIQRKIPRVRLGEKVAKELGDAPDGMKRSHRHHILDVNGRPGEHRKAVREGQEILRNYGIDPLEGVENLVWAPNKGHTKQATLDLVYDLRGAQADGANRQAIEYILRRYGEEARRR